MASISYPPIFATAVVPWDENFAFDEPAFRRQVRTIAQGITRYIYIFGTAGEGYAVNDRQFEEIARAFWKVSQENGVTAVLGIISLSLPTIVDRIRLGREIGFREFQISLPSWGALKDEELELFFARTCGDFRDCRFHHYNLMRTKRLLTSVEYSRIAKAHSNFVAIKAGSSDPAVIADLLKLTPRVRLYLTEFGYEIARRTHDVGLLLSLSSPNYTRAKEFVSGTNARRAADIGDLNALLPKLLEAGGGRFHIDGAYDKILYRVHDRTFPLRVLPPYSYASEDEFNEFLSHAEQTWLRPGKPV
jgi:hypothetical protein